MGAGCAEKANANRYLSMLLFFAITCLLLSPCKSFGQVKSLAITPGKSITIHTNMSGTAAAYQWYKNGVPIEGAVHKDYTITQPGNYTVRAFNSESCPSDPSDGIDVHVIDHITDMIVVKKSESKDVHVGEPFEYSLTVTNNGPVKATKVKLNDALPPGLEYVSIKSSTLGSAVYDANSRIITWTIGDVELNAMANLRLVVKATNYGAVTNTAVVSAFEEDKNMDNNTSSDTKTILGITIPNVFTPNGDGKNDAFVIPDLPSNVENEILIINRWGNSVYQKKNYHNEWTGEGLNEGTYFYILKVKNAANWDAYKGYVTLLRSK